MLPDKILNGLFNSVSPVDTQNNIRYFQRSVLERDIPKELEPLLKICFSYFDKSGNVLDSEMLGILLQKSKVIQDQEKAKMLAMFSQHSLTSVPFAKFKFYVDEFNVEREQKWLADIQTVAVVALESQWQDPKSKIIYQGNEGSSLLLKRAVFENPYRKTTTSTPQGNIRLDGAEVMDEYDRKKREVRGRNELFTGIKAIDQQTGGNKRGELILVGAYTGEGKSQMLVNFSHNICTVQGKNGLIITAETSRPIYRRRLYCRHSCVPGVGAPAGLDSSKVRDATLSPEEEAVFVRVVKDFCENPDYGQLFISQLPRSATVKDCILAAEEINATTPLDFLCVDYLELLAASRKRSSRREEIEEILAEAKEGALTFDNGRGICTYAAHQLKQSSRESVKAEDEKFYTISDFAHTSEAGKSADVAIMILRTDKLKEANEIAAKVVKLRDGDPEPMFRLYERYSSSFIGDLAT